MKTKLLGAVAALALSASVSQADIIDITFTGLAFAAYYTDTESAHPILHQDHDIPFTAEFHFNTDLGTLDNLRLDGGLVSAWITLEGIPHPRWGGNFGVLGNSLLWDSTLTDISANAFVAGFRHITIDTMPPHPEVKYGNFQFGLCPTIVGGPCGVITSIDSMTVNGFLPVPAPIAGAGIPGLLLFAGLLAWWRRKFAQG